MHVRFRVNFLKIVRPLLSMGAVFSMLGGLYFWFEKITGTRYAEILGKIHFWSFFVGVNLTFFPMHFLGVAGMPRRVPDYPDAYFIFNKIASWGSYISAVSSIFFFYVVYNAFTKGQWHLIDCNFLVDCFSICAQSKSNF